MPPWSTYSPTRTLAPIIRRIVDVAAPERIVLFGSHATGTARSDTDYDLLVVQAGIASRRALAQVEDLDKRLQARRAR